MYTGEEFYFMKTLKSLRLHIGIFGKTNVGKSAFLNRITNQDISIVSEIAGTTTDVVEKSMELLPVGAVVFLDTAGINDTTALGKERIEKTMKVINRTDVAVIICDYKGFDEYEIGLVKKFEELKIPFMVVVTKSDVEEISDVALEKIKSVVGENTPILKTSATSDKEIVFKFKAKVIKNGKTSKYLIIFFLLSLIFLFS